LMRVKTPKQRSWSQGLLDRSIEFHGHGGPFMVVGLRMGMTALEMLDARGWFDLRCLARLRWEPPDSCVVDGIQISSGCTMGKHNIEVEERDGVAAEFAKGERRLEMRLRAEVLESIRGVLALNSEEDVESLMSELMEAPRGELFQISRSP
jgi:formylmethanofuran dehydrogenase subunit E